MSLLVDQQIKATTKLSVLNLQYNNISVLIQNSINKLLMETSYAIQNDMDDEQLCMQAVSDGDNTSKNRSPVQMRDLDNEGLFIMQDGNVLSRVPS